MQTEQEQAIRYLSLVSAATNALEKDADRSDTARREIILGMAVIAHACHTYLARKSAYAMAPIAEVHVERLYYMLANLVAYTGRFAEHEKQSESAVRLNNNAHAAFNLIKQIHNAYGAAHEFP